MTSEELEAEIKKIDENLESLPADDKPITKEERKEKGLLLLKQSVLLRIKDAREKNYKQSEFENTIQYGVLNSWISKHAFLMHFMINSKCRWNIF